MFARVKTYPQQLVIYGLRKAAIPPDISVVGVCDFTKFRIPPPLSFELKTMSRIFPCSGAEKPIHPLVFPDIFPRTLHKTSEKKEKRDRSRESACSVYEESENTELKLSFEVFFVWYPTVAHNCHGKIKLRARK